MLWLPTLNNCNFNYFKKALELLTLNDIESHARWLNWCLVYFFRECSSYKWKKASWMMKSTVPQKPRCCWHPTPARPNTEITTPRNTSQASSPMTDSYPRGKLPNVTSHGSGVVKNSLILFIFVGINFVDFVKITFT